jgi:amino-acid N-acetyltransferase
MKGESKIEIRKANVRDVPSILEIVNDYAQEQVMLARSPLAIYENLRDYIVAVDADQVIGCGALHVVWGDLSEVRSIAIRKDRKGKGIGKLVAEALLEEANTLLLPKVFAFTYVPGFFESLGFRVVPHSELPHKVFTDCLNCPKFNACDEIAVLLDLRPVDGTFPQTGPLSRPVPGLFQGPFPLPDQENTSSTSKKNKHE